VQRILVDDAVTARRRTRMESEPWTLDHLEVDAKELRARGWAFPPVGWTGLGKQQFTLNGRPIADVRFAPRPDVASVFWQREYAEGSGFELTAPFGDAEPYPGGYLELAYANAPSRPPHGLRHAWYLRDPNAEGPLPTAAQRHRVIGNEDDFGFRLTGATDFNRLVRALAAVAKRPVGTFESVLDWGVGCGRVARYMSREIGARLTGCDIDPENVRWCAANLPGRYVDSSMHPPLPFAQDAFDLAYGVSVFTHLREPLQDAWLAELQRVMRPGGILLVTVHGPTAVEYAGLKPDDLVAMKRATEAQGVFMGSTNDQLAGAVEHAEEYVNVHHSRGYIRRHWSKWFEILAILPGYIYTHDLLVLRRRT